MRGADGQIHLASPDILFLEQGGIMKRLALFPAIFLLALAATFSGCAARSSGSAGSSQRDVMRRFHSTSEDRAVRKSMAPKASKTENSAPRAN